MAITFTYTGPLAKPTGLTITRNAGAGTWNAGTYKFRVQTGNQSLNSDNGVASEVSDEFVIELQNNDSITVDFEPVDGAATNYQLFFEKEGHSTLGFWNWVNVNDGADSIGDLPKTFTNPRHRYHNYTYNPFHLYPYKSMGLPRDKGWFNLEITGDGDFDIGDINEYLRTAAADQEGILWFDNRDIGLYLMGNIHAESFGTGTLTMSGNIFVNFRPFRLSGGLKLHMNKTVWISGNRDLSDTRDIIRNFEITNSQLLTDFLKPISGIYFYTIFDNHIIKNSYINIVLLNLDLASYIGEKTKFPLDARLEGTLESIEFEGGIYWVCYQDAFIKKCKIGVDLDSYMFLKAANTDSVCEFRDCEFISFVDDSDGDLSWNIGDRIPLSELFYDYNFTIYHYKNTDGQSMIKFTNTVDLTIKDNDNNNLEGVDVVITNSGDTIVYSGTTDSSGNINTIIEILRLEAVQNKLLYHPN
jgi:hypothetical protein